MRRVLDNLHNKPEIYRRRVALLATIAITGIIASFWVTSVRTQVLTRRVEEMPASENRSPFQTLKKSFSEFGESLRAQVGNIKDIFQSFSR